MPRRCGHGDHWFGLSTLLRPFPDTEVVATAGAVAMMTSVVARPTQTGVITLEGHELRIIDVGHTDTDATAVLHVPLLDLVVAGDAVYNGVHQYLVESADGGRAAWLAAIDVIEALEPRVVIAGHKNPDLDDDAARVLTGTRDYLRSVEKMLAEQRSADGFVDAMTARYPDLLNPDVVRMNATALYA